MKKGKARTPKPAAALPQTQSTAISKAKGRPMLTWVGKRPLTEVTSFPAQLVEKFDPNGNILKQADYWKDWPEKYPKGGLLFHGDNKEVLAHLLANGFRGKVKLVYIDPPFDSGADYVRRVTLRGPSGQAKLEGEGYSIGEQIQYSDIWANDNYLQFMYERLLLLKELLADDGVIWLHCDWNRSHQLRSLMDEVFGPDSLLNEIVWQRISAHPDSTFFGHVHDTLFFYAKDPDKVTFNTIYAPYSDDFIQRYFTRDDNDGRGPYWTGDLTAPGPRPGLDYDLKGRRPPSGRVWFTKKEKMLALDEDNRIYWPPSGGVPKLKRYLKEYPGVPASSLWTDVKSLAGLGAKAAERTDYPTQKPEVLLDRVLRATSGTGDLVLDCFIGSGTTAAVAQKIGRRWIGCDINKGAIQITTGRLQTIIRDQHMAFKQTKLGPEPKAEPLPAQLGLSVYRVNDYDLQIQHNEAVNLACEHIGIQRTKNDTYFDGTLGERLVKIAPFNHPLSPVDLEDLKTELKARPSEQRDIVVVALGKERSIDEWLDDWNRLRKKGEVPNKIEVIELRTHPKYGKFFVHKPAQARVSVKRQGEKLLVSVEDFISPTVMERLQQQSGIVKAHVENWKSVVDSVAIDPAYDGKVFNMVSVDVPQDREDLVAGRYELKAPSGKTTVAVRITDVLGEEVISTHLI